MSMVQLQQSTLLPLLRVACQTLTVQSLDLLQIKAAGSATLRCYDAPLQPVRSPVMVANVAF